MERKNGKPCDYYVFNKTKKEQTFCNHFCKTLRSYKAGFSWRLPLCFLLRGQKTLQHFLVLCAGGGGRGRPPGCHLHTGCERGGGRGSLRDCMEYAGHKSPSLPTTSDGVDGKFAIKLKGFFGGFTIWRLILLIPDESSVGPSELSSLSVGRGGDALKCLDKFCLVCVLGILCFFPSSGVLQIFLTLWPCSYSPSSEQGVSRKGARHSSVR